LFFSGNLPEWLRVMKRLTLLALFALFLGAGMVWAQRFRPRWGGGEGLIPEDWPGRTAREAPSHSAETPTWTNAPGFEKDVFTFTRVRYHRLPWGMGSRRAGYCFIDFPDSDLNLSYRLQQMTSIHVDPNGRVIGLTEPELFDYPWIYMVEPGALHFEEDEIVALRKYLRNGGFLMADDFWGQRQWDNFEQEIKRVLPEYSFKELEMDHPIFHSVFDLRMPKNGLQTPNYMTGEESQYTGVTWEVHDGEECREVHIRAIFDDKGRMMVIATHNTDNGDGWEREQENHFFFKEFSEKRAYLRDDALEP
jgi:hypothetical protein